jgi:hypothetical protein
MWSRSGLVFDCLNNRYHIHMLELGVYTVEVHDVCRLFSSLTLQHHFFGQLTWSCLAWSFSIAADIMGMTFLSLCCSLCDKWARPYCVRLLVTLQRKEIEHYLMIVQHIPPPPPTFLVPGHLHHKMNITCSRFWTVAVLKIVLLS